MCITLIEVHLCGIRGKKAGAYRCDASRNLQRLAPLTSLDVELGALYAMECLRDARTHDKVRADRNCDACVAKVEYYGEGEAHMKCLVLEAESRERAQGVRSPLDGMGEAAVGAEGGGGREEAAAAAAEGMKEEEDGFEGELEEMMK